MDNIELIINRLIRIIPFEGISNNTLLKACIDLKLNTSFCKFPNGIYSALNHILNDFNDLMRRELNIINLNDIKVHERIKLAVKIRLVRYTKLPNYREFIKNILSFAIKNPYFAAKALSNTVDHIWNGIGDTSTDFNYYTKRLILAQIYSSTLFYFVNDYSESFTDTLSFLDKRVKNVMAFHKLKKQIQSFIPTFKPFDVKFD